jgi:endonuclease/exonuclease/phosphatase family metal-dependent hydrolase
MKKRFLKAMAMLVVTILILISGFFIFLMVTEFRPPKWSSLPIEGMHIPPEPGQREFTLLTWNIGYAGLGAGVDYFYDGGKMVRVGKNETEQNLKSIGALILAHDSVDFILLQEVDRHSKRSWNIDELEDIAARIPGFARVFAPNYDCRYIPVPLTEPLGQVQAGLATFCRTKPTSASVQYFDAYFSWPTRLVFLKRCLLMTRHPLDNGKELVVINTHNSAYDSTGELQHRELFILDSVMQGEYRKGNYVIAGGDWNSNPRGFDPSRISTGDKTTTIGPPVGNDFLPGWHFVFDTLRPSNRFLDMAYARGKTLATTIDFFVLSPNLEVEMVKTIATGFQWSDHEGVVMKVRIVTE